jgi:hypothetical protein
MDGTVRTQDKQKAHNLLKDLAEKGYLPSYYDLAMSYIWGNGVKQNAVKGVEWMKKSATKASDARAMESLAQILLEHRAGYLAQVKVLDSIESGIELRKKAAELGDTNAQLRLFVHYYNGDHVPMSKAEAIKWLKRSAEGGNPDAQYDLGLQFLNGWNIPKDIKKTAALYESAAKKGHPKAILGIGSLYAVGLGEIDKDNTVALSWLEQLPEQEAAMAIGWIYAEGGHGVIQNRALAEKWLRKSDEQLALGMIPALYLNDKYGPIDLDKVISLAVEIEPLLTGESLSSNQAILAISYEAKNNWESSLLWANKAANSGNSEPLQLLGLRLITGEKYGKNTSDGLELLTRSAISGSEDSQYLLGLLYSVGSVDLGFGSGIKFDAVKAEKWLSMAVAQGSSKADELLVYLDAELEARDAIIAKQREVLRLERIARLEKVEREKRTLQKQIAEYERQLAYQANQPQGPSLAEQFIGSFFDVLGQAVVIGVTAKIDKELGIKSYAPNSSRLRGIEKTGEEIRLQARREARKVIRMEKVMKNLRTPARIGCESYGC